VLLSLAWSIACGPASPADTARGGDDDSAALDDDSGGAGSPDLDATLAALRENLDGALLAESITRGWPVHTADGVLFVCADCGDGWRLAGDHDGWTGATALTPDDGFRWALLPDDGPLGAYKFTDGATWAADPWSRIYGEDSYGEMSYAALAGARMERHFGVEGGGLAPRMLRIRVPAMTPDRVLYVHDGQNLFLSGGSFGSWRLEESAPDGVLVVGIDNTAVRIDEYTHVVDLIDGDAMGGRAEDYAALVDAARARVDAVYGEPGVVGTMGSSLGGLVSFALADLRPGEFDFAASLSGTMGWGSIGTDNPTMIARYAAAGHRDTALYLDSGGGGSTCADADADGTNDDDPDASDNYCENLQLRDVLAASGYAFDVDLWHWHAPGASHSEAAWAERVWRPLQIFAGL
jgi:predicted alpha/beta superfamily hydrolase